MGRGRSGPAQPRSMTCSRRTMADTLGGNRPCTPHNRTPRSDETTSENTRRSRRRIPDRRTMTAESASRLLTGNTLRNL